MSADAALVVLAKRWNKAQPGRLSLAAEKKQVVCFVFPDQKTAEAFVRNMEAQTICGQSAEVEVIGIPFDHFNDAHFDECKSNHLRVALGWGTSETETYKLPYRGIISFRSK